MSRPAALDVNSTIGILGGGQLGRMLALAAARLGFRCHVLSPDADSPAFDVVPQPNDLASLPLLHSRFTRLPENGFKGSNFSRMMDPQFDALIDRWQTTIPKAERMQALGQILYEISDRLNAMPLVYGVRPIALGNRLQNVGVGPSVESSQAWNAQAWDVK